MSNNNSKLIKVFCCFCFFCEEQRKKSHPISSFLKPQLCDMDEGSTETLSFSLCFLAPRIVLLKQYLGLSILGLFSSMEPHCGCFSGTCYFHSTSWSSSGLLYLELSALISYSLLRHICSNVCAGTLRSPVWSEVRSCLFCLSSVSQLFISQNSSCGICMRPEKEVSSSRQDLLFFLTTKENYSSWVSNTPSPTPCLYFPDSRFQLKSE